MSENTIGGRPGEALAPRDETKIVDNLVGRLFSEIRDRADYLRRCESYLQNHPLGDKEYRPEREKQFHGMAEMRDMARTNYARIVVAAVTDHCGIDGYRTSNADDDFGDDVVESLFDRDDMGYQMQDAISLATGYGRSYLFVDPASQRASVIPPNNAAVLTDLNDEPAAGLVVRRDQVRGIDILNFYYRDIDERTGTVVGPVREYIATRDFAYGTGEGMQIRNADTVVPFNGFLSSGWTWWKNTQNVPNVSRIPVTPLKNGEGESEFLPAEDIINRINHVNFQRAIIITLQAFKQRAIKGNLPKKDVNGREIDYSDLFVSSPASMWTLPEGSEIWESSSTETQSLLESVRADERALGAQTATPMNYFSDSVNNSAEGAITQKENHIAKVKDRRRRFEARIRRHVSILLEANGEKERSNIGEIEVIWEPLEALSLVERVASFATLMGQGLALTTALREGMQMKPREIKRAEDERLSDLLYNQLQSELNVMTPLQKSSLGNTAETLSRAANVGRERGGESQ